MTEFIGWPFDRAPWADAESSTSTPVASPAFIPKGDKGTPEQNKGTKPSLMVGGNVITQDFILIEANEEMEERLQTVDTFGVTYAFFLGRKPRIFSYTLLLLDTYNNPWKDRLMSLWENSLRGSISAANGVHATLSYNGMARHGFLLSLRVRAKGDAQPIATASISMLISHTLPDWNGTKLTSTNGIQTVTG